MQTATTPKIVLTDTGTKRLRKGWYFQATIGPFKNQQDVYEFVRRTMASPQGGLAEPCPGHFVEFVRKAGEPKGQNETTSKDKFS